MSCLLDATRTGSEASPTPVPFDHQLYRELRRIALAKLRRQAPNCTLQATQLVHEVYIRFAQTFSSEWSEKRGEFCVVASKAMQSMVIDHFRRKKAIKRGGSLTRLELEVDSLQSPTQPIDVDALKEALDALDHRFPVQAQLVRLRFFCGMSMPECSQALGISLSQAERHWRFTRAWLADRIGDCLVK